MLKFAGNIVIPGKHVVRIQLDHRFQSLFDKHRQRNAVDEPKDEQHDTST